MDGPFGSLLMRVYVRGWCRGNERHLSILASWIDLLARGNVPTFRHVAAASGQEISMVHTVIRAFIVDVRRVQKEEEELGTPIERWVVDEGQGEEKMGAGSPQPHQKEGKEEDDGGTF